MSGNENDAELVRRCLRGDGEAFRPLVEKYQGVLFNVAYRMVHDREDARDLAQGAFVKAYEKLGSYIAAMDVCVIPLKVNDLMRSADPNKLYEYAACGRPIVTMKHSEDLEPLRGMIHLAGSHDEFIEGIRLALAAGANGEKLLEFARSRSWQARADEIASLIRESIARRSANRKLERGDGRDRRTGS